MIMYIVADTPISCHAPQSRYGFVSMIKILVSAWGWTPRNGSYSKLNLTVKTQAKKPPSREKNTNKATNKYPKSVENRVEHKHSQTRTEKEPRVNWVELRLGSLENISKHFFKKISYSGQGTFVSSSGQLIFSVLLSHLVSQLILHLSMCSGFVGSKHSSFQKTPSSSHRGSEKYRIHDWNLKFHIFKNIFSMHIWPYSRIYCTNPKPYTTPA